MELIVMASVHDVAKYILGACGEMTTMKLQKLCYYAQAWSLVWDGKPIFPDQIEAWVNGPVIPNLYQEHRGKFSVSASELSFGDANRLTSSERDTIDAVLDHYGSYSGTQLSQITHHESPWLDARVGCSQYERCQNVISLDAMADFYTAMYAEA